MKIYFVLAYLVVISDARDCSWMKNRLDKNPIKHLSDDSDIINRIYPWPKDLETLVNQQIVKELNAFYNYLSMSHFFEREDHYLEGFAKYFHDAAMEELKHAEMFMKYQAKRGGRVHLQNLPAPSKQSWNNGYHVFKAALKLEKNVTDEVMCLHQLANNIYDDVDFVNFVEGEIVPEQLSGLKDLTNHIMTLHRMSAGKDAKGEFANYGIAEALYDNKLKEN